MTRDCLRPMKTSQFTTALAAVVCLCAPVLGFAQDVTLTSSRGANPITGKITGYDGTFVEIDSAFGLLTLDYASVVCTGDGCPDAQAFVPEVLLSGAARMGEIMLPGLIEAYGRSRGWQTEIVADDPVHLTVTLRDEDAVDQARFRVRLTTTDEGFADLIVHEADVVLAQREIRKTEADRAAVIGLGDMRDPAQARIIGFDALVPVVHPALDADTIALRDLVDVFRGEVSDWATLESATGPITAHLGARTDGAMQFFVDEFVVFDESVLGDAVARHPTREALLEALRDQPGSLSLVPFGAVGGAKALDLMDACGFIAAPNDVMLKTQDYPLTQPLFLYLPDRLRPALIDDFLNWMRGPEAQLVVRRAGFVDQGAVPIPLDAQGQRFANAIAQAGEDVSLGELQRMVRVLKPRTRLSLSFRFEVGSTRLDAVSRTNLLAVAQGIRDGDYDGQSLMFVGFSDARGAPLPNRDLSSARAEAVKRELTDVLGALPDEVTIESEAFGEALPLGCDDTEWGRQMNRRVELWVAEK